MNNFDYPILKCFPSQSFFKSTYKALDIITAFKTVCFSQLSLLFIYSSLALQVLIVLYYETLFFKGIIHFKMKFQIFLLEIL